MLQERPDWYSATRAASKKWMAPTPVILAIIWRESRFQPEAQTPRNYALGVVPWGRQSSAYGFAQAIDGTWEWYQNETGADDADRTEFADAADFVGWYMTKSRKELGLRPHDAKTHYLAYHEGHGGFRGGGWRQKGFLVKASNEVARMAALYDTQLRECDAVYARERMLAKTPVPKTRPFALAKISGVPPIRKPKTTPKKPTPIAASMRVTPTAKPEKPAPRGLPDGP